MAVIRKFIHNSDVVRVQTVGQDIWGHPAWINEITVYNDLPCRIWQAGSELKDGDPGNPKARQTPLNKWLMMHELDCPVMPLDEVRWRKEKGDKTLRVVSSLEYDTHIESVLEEIAP